MSTLEATVSMIELLSEDNLMKAQNFARTILVRQRMEEVGVGAITKQQFLDELDISREQTEQGKCRSARAALHDMRERYGV